MAERSIGLGWAHSEGPQYSKIANQVILNGKTLVPQAPWNRLLGEEFLCWSGARGNAGLSGKGIAAKTIARTIDSLRTRMAWDTISPEIVYVSGLYLLSAASEKLQSSQNWLSEIASGARRFPIQEQQESAVAMQQATIDLLSGFRNEMERALEQYCGENLPGGTNDKRYRELLLYLFKSAGGDQASGIPAQRVRIFNLLKEGNIDLAHKLIRF